MKASEAGSDRQTIAARFVFKGDHFRVRDGDWMKVDEEIFNSWSELAIQDLLMDVAAVVDATETDWVWNGTVSSRPNVEFLRQRKR